MKISVSASQCQLPSLQPIAVDNAQGPPISSQRRLKLIVRRIAGPTRERKIKHTTNRLLNIVPSVPNLPLNRDKKPSLRMKISEDMNQGDWVKVRSFNEIQAGLNSWRQLKGCTFMTEMAEYCGSIQSVYKVMETFVDERDYTLKKSKGIILLNGVMCGGTAEFGKCDRACLHFWRKEWLEKIDEPESVPNHTLIQKNKPEEWVTVRPMKQIRNTLDINNSLKGCNFIPEMQKYCNTSQRVLKHVETFVDERELRLKKAAGIVILDRAICHGDLGENRCDRSCHFLWRKEWIEY